MKSSFGPLILGLLLLAGVLDSALIKQPQTSQSLSRSKREAPAGCTMNPDTDEENVLDEGQSITLECTFTDDVTSCNWMHTEPMNEGEYTNGQHDIECDSVAQLSGQQCTTENRVTFQHSGNKCGIQISNTEPEDTGHWKLSAGVKNGDSTTNENKDFEVYTYNQSTVYMVDVDDNEVDNFDTTYNRNERQNKWEPDTNGWESVEFKAHAYGGRPAPTFHWYIENNDNDDLADMSHFTIRDGALGDEDRYGYIENWESRIEFEISDELLVILEDYGIDTNPKEEHVTFTLNCDVDQGDGLFITQTLEVDIDILKSYDNHMLASDTIGIIVGVVLIVVIIIIAVAVVLFAKSSRTLCFADNRNAGYNDPQNPKSHPRSASSAPGGGGKHGGRSSGDDRHHRRDSRDRDHHKSNPQVYRDNIEDKNRPPSRSAWETTKPPSRSSTTSSTSAEIHKPPISSSSNSTSTPKKSSTPATLPLNHGLGLQQQPLGSPSSSSEPSAPPRPAKPGAGGDLTYANLDHRPWVNDPRNQVLPPPQAYPNNFVVNPNSRQEPTQYASITSKPKLV